MNINDLFKASFGQFGSVYLTGDGALLDLDGATANRFVIAIQFMEDTTFEKLQTLDGLVNSITSDTFPKGITIYGKWDHIELNGGSCICYLAPVGY